MRDRQPISVLLPTIDGTTACDELCAQLEAEDELLVICDQPDDPVARWAEDTPDTVRLLVAGEPTACSGKANAIAAGMEAATHDRLVWTDDDFFHPPDWLERLAADYDRQGPISELPIFVGHDPLGITLEPLYSVSMAAFYADNTAWAGAVIFDRSDLDERSFLRDLRRTVSDDGLLTERVDITTVKRTRCPDNGSRFATTLSNHVRYTKIFRHHEPFLLGVNALIGGLLTAGLLLFPIPIGVLLTLSTAGIYAYFGIRRWTFLLAVPSVLLLLPPLVYALTRRTFTWSGRRYRWNNKFNVSVESD